MCIRDSYGDALGIAFQIVDDLLDVTGDSNATGKNIGDDFRERKLTLPFIKAISKANPEEREFWSRTIATGAQKDGDLEHALDLLSLHGAIDETRQDALYWANRAQQSISLLPKHDIRDILHSLALYVVDRIN